MADTFIAWLIQVWLCIIAVTTFFAAFTLFDSDRMRLYKVDVKPLSALALFALSAVCSVAALFVGRMF
jgi:hypothetical protein